MRVVLFGYYGFGNAGDEAVLAGLLRGLRRFGPEDAEYIVLSGNPKETERLHGVEARPRDSWRTLAAESGAADAWVLGGGSLLQDVSGRLTMPYYLGVMTLLAWRRQRFFFHAQGVGPVNGRLNRRLTAALLTRAERISVRDAESRGRLASYGVPVERIHLGADLGLLLDEESLVSKVGVERNVPEERPLIGLAVRPWGELEQWLPGLIVGVRRFLRQVGAHLLVVPMDERHDRELAERIVETLPGEAMVAAAGTSFQENLGLIAHCQMMLSMRLHGAVFAAIAGVPCVMVEYDPKVSAFARSTGSESLSVHGMSEEVVYQCLVRTWERRSSQAERLAEVVADLRQRAEQDTAALAAAIAGRAMERVPT